MDSSRATADIDYSILQFWIHPLLEFAVSVTILVISYQSVQGSFRYTSRRPSEANKLLDELVFHADMYY